jgi:tRNA-dihydrouridine synthase B
MESPELKSQKPKSPIQPIQIGNLTLPINVFYAPLAGCSDFPFRKMAALYNPGLIFCEMVKMDAIIRNDPSTFRILDYSTDMHPIGGQLCGSKPEIAGQAAKIVEDLGFDVIDLNCGCPVDKVTKDGSGSGLLKDPERIGDIVSNMLARVKIPVTVKIRAGWCENTLVAEQIVKIAEDAGASSICIHGRTRVQGYKGPANWDWIRAAKQAAKKIKVFGNGDIFTPQAAFDMFSHTGCDGVLVARGTMGHPWIVDDIRCLVEGKTPPVRSVDERRKALIEHLNYITEYHLDRKVVIDMRRVGCWYFKKSKGTKAFREAISKASTVEDVKNLVYSFPIDESGAEEDEIPSECEC